MQLSSKFTELKSLPKGWDVVELGQIGTISKGSGIKNEQIRKNGIPCITYGDIYTKYNISTKILNSFIDKSICNEAKKIKKNDILFAGSGETAEEIGKTVVYLGDEKAYAGGDIIILTPKDDVDSYYVSIFLNSEMGIYQKSRMGEGYSVVHIYPEEIKKIKLVFPPLPEQKAISEILSTLDSAIEKTEQLIRLKEEYKKGIIRTLLEGKMRMQNHCLKKWKKQVIGDFIVERNERTTINNQFNIITSARSGIHLQQDYFDRQVASSNNIGYKIIKNGDFTYRSMSDDRKFYFNHYVLPKVGMVSPAYEVFYFKNMNSIYAKYLLNSDIFYRELLKDIQGGTRVSVKLESLKKVFLKIPDLDEQNDIAEVLTQFEEELRLLKQKLALLQTQKKGLMQQLLTGKIRVKIPSSQKSTLADER
jgi:type I restriction enzyme S subunit